MSAQPNIVFVTCHDLGRFLGCYGVETVHTPSVDALAADSVVFNQAYCTAPQCSPARSSLFTGRYPHANGVMGLTQPPFDWDLNDGEQHIAQTLGDLGYRTSLVGIHHESKTGDNDFIAKTLGFDVVQQRGQRGEDVTALAVAQIEELTSQDQPFYLQVGYLEPHRLRTRERKEDDYQGFIGDYLEPDSSRGTTVPGYLVDDELGRAEIAELQGAVRYLDQQMGALHEALTRAGVADDTIFVFITDHGLALPRAKCSLYDPGIEVAFFMRCPRLGWDGGTRRDELVSGVDLVPTLLDVVGAEAPHELHGRSLVPLLNGDETAWRDELFAEFTFHEYYDPRRCVRTDQYKLIVNFTVAPGFMDCSSSWRPRTKPIAPVNNPAGFHPPVELYDLASDPLEMTNVANDPALADIRQDLLARLDSWMRDTGDPLLSGAVTPPLHHVALDALGKESGG